MVEQAADRCRDTYTLFPERSVDHVREEVFSDDEQLMTTWSSGTVTVDCVTVTVWLLHAKTDQDTWLKFAILFDFLLLLDCIFINTLYTHARTHARTRARTHPHARTHTYTPHTNTHTYTHTQTNTPTHAYTQTQTHKHTHIHAQTHTQTQTTCLSWSWCIISKFTVFYLPFYFYFCVYYLLISIVYIFIQITS